MICRHCIVSGRVQGVWFRDSTRRRARALGVRGHALNRADGTVEVLACGPQAAVESLCDWLHEGPPLAEVESVRCREWDGDPPEGFEIG